MTSTRPLSIATLREERLRQLFDAWEADPERRLPTFLEDRWATQGAPFLDLLQSFLAEQITLAEFRAQVDQRARGPEGLGFGGPAGGDCQG